MATSGLSNDNCPLSRASPPGSGQLSPIIPQYHGITITHTYIYIYIYIYIRTPAPITQPPARACACGVMNVESNVTMKIKQSLSMATSHVTPKIFCSPDSVDCASPRVELE